MDCKRVLAVLEDLEKKSAAGVSVEELTYLYDKGLVLLMATVAYGAKAKEAAKLPGVETQLGDQQLLQKGLDQDFSRLERKIGSGWHKFWRKSETIEADEKFLAQGKKQREANEAEIKRLTAEAERLKGIKSDIEGYVLGSEGSGSYAALSERGKLVLKRLAAGIARVETRPFDEYDKSLKIVEKAVDRRYGRFLEMYEFLASQGFSKDSKVAQYALSLSGMRGMKEEINARAAVINDFLYNANWQSYDRLKIAAVVAGQKGDINGLKDKLSEMFSLMTENGHSKCYATWSEAAAIMKIPGATAEEKFGRFEKMRDALAKRQWSKNSAASCAIAASLSLRKGEPEDIAEEFRTLEKKLVEQGRNDSTESGIAALISINLKGTLDERAGRFAEAYDAMMQNGWKSSTEYYAPAAVIALAPGSIGENVQRMDEVYGRLKSDGFESNLTGRAAAIVSGCFRDLMMQYYPVTMSSGEDADDFDYGDDGDPGDPIFAAAIAMALGGDPMIAFSTAMLTGNMWFGVMAGMAWGDYNDYLDTGSADDAIGDSSLPDGSDPGSQIDYPDQPDVPDGGDVPDTDVPDVDVPDVPDVDVPETDFDVGSSIDTDIGGGSDWGGSGGDSGGGFDGGGGGSSD